MRWCVVYHPELHTTGVIAESALPIHRNVGWFRVTDWAENPDDLRTGLACGELHGEPVPTEPQDPAEEPTPPGGPPVDLDAQPAPPKTAKNKEN